MDEIIKFGGVLGFLLGLADFNNYEFSLKSGSVKRVFEDEGHHDVMLEFNDSRVCYAKHTDFFTIDKVIKTYRAENQGVKRLREVIPGLQKRFERFGVICSRYPDLSPTECLSNLNWSNDKEGKSLTTVTHFMQMKEFKYKFKNKEIKLIPND